MLVADLYVVLYDAIKEHPDSTGHGREGFYFGESGEHNMYEVGQAVSQALVDVGKGKSREPTTFTQEEIDKYFAVRFLNELTRDYPHFVVCRVRRILDPIRDARAIDRGRLGGSP